MLGYDGRRTWTVSASVAMVASSAPLALLLSLSSFLVTSGVAADGLEMVSTVTSGQWRGPSFFYNNEALRSVAYLGNELSLLALSPVKKRGGKESQVGLFLPSFSGIF